MDKIGLIGQNIFFDIINYREVIDNICKIYEGQKDLTSNLNIINLEINLNNSVRHYFSKKYQGSSESIQLLGQIVEDLSIQLARIVKVQSKGIIRETHFDFEQAINLFKQNLPNIANKIRCKENLEDFEVDLKTLVTTDKMLELLRDFRNLSSHPYELKREREDAKIVLDNTVYLLKNILNYIKSVNS